MLFLFSPFQAQYWGLSDDINGCKACDCDVGGSLDNNCDQINGQCNCRPNIITRQCNQAKPGYFITYLDYLAYEGEFATGTGVGLRYLFQGKDTEVDMFYIDTEKNSQPFNFIKCYQIILFQTSVGSVKLESQSITS